MILGFRHRRAGAPIAIAVLVALALGVAGCGDNNGGSDARRATYVGMVQGSSTAIALVRNGDTVAGYVCADRGLSIWFVEKEISDGKATLTNRRGEEVGTVSFGDKRASGEVTVEGDRLAFIAEPATGDGGLFRGLPADGDAAQELGVIAISLPAPSNSGLGDASAPVAFVTSRHDLQTPLYQRIIWIIRNDDKQVGTVVQFRGTLPEVALAQPFRADVTYPAIAEVIGADDFEGGTQADPQGQRDVELLGGTRYRISRLGPGDLD
jgi:hypothetical protein